MEKVWETVAKGFDFVSILRSTVTTQIECLIDNQLVYLTIPGENWFSNKVAKSKSALC